MALYYVDSNAVGLNDGSSKANAFISVGSLIGLAVKGDIAVISHLHSEPVEDIAQDTSVYNFGKCLMISSDFSGVNDIDYVRATSQNFYYNLPETRVDFVDVRIKGLYLSSLRDFELKNVTADECIFHTGDHTYGQTVSYYLNGAYITNCHFLNENEHVVGWNNYGAMASSGGSKNILRHCKFTRTIAGLTSAQVDGWSLFNVNHYSSLIFDSCDFSEVNVSSSVICYISSWQVNIEIINCNFSDVVTRFIGVESQAIEDRSSLLAYGNTIGTDKTQFEYITHTQLAKLDKVYYPQSAHVIDDIQFSYLIECRSTADAYWGINSVSVGQFKLVDGNQKTITIELAQIDGSSPLLWHEVCLSISYEDQSGNKVFDSYDYNALVDSTETWVGMTNPVRQKVTLPMSVVAGDCILNVTLSIQRDDTVVNACAVIS